MLTFRRSALALLVLVTLLPTAVFGQVGRAGIVTTLEGSVTARRAALPQPVALKFKDDVFFQDTIATGDRALARVLLGGKSVVTVRERSVVKITELPGRSTINLESGKIGVAVARDRMVPGESVDIRTPTAVLGIRGTVIVAEVVRATAQNGGAVAGVTTNFFMLRGSGDVRRLDPITGAPVGPPVTLTAMQQIIVTGSSVRVAPIAPGQVAQVTAGLESKGHPHVEAANQDQVKGQVTRATSAVLGALTSGRSGQAVTTVVSAATAAAVVTNPNPTSVVTPILPQVQSCTKSSCGGTTAAQAAIIVAAMPVVAPPVVDPPVVASPIVTPPVVTPPVVAAPVVESPTVAPPVVNVPVVTAPVVQTPVVEPPVVGTPVVARPVIDVPVETSPGVDAPVVDPTIGEQRSTVLPVIALPFPERLVIDDVLDLTDLERVTVAGGTFTRSQTSSPFQVLNSTLNYVDVGTDPLVLVSGADTVVNLAGGLATIVNSTITTSGTLFALANGGRFTSTVGSTVGGALIDVDASTITSARAIVALLNGAALTIDGPLVRTLNTSLSTTDPAIPAFPVINGASLITTSPSAVFEPSVTEVTTAGSFLALASNAAVGTPSPASLTLAGELLRASNTHFTVGNPLENAQSLVFIGDGSTLTSTSPNALLSFVGESSVNASGNIVTLRRSLPGLPSQIILSGPLLFSDASTFATKSLGLGAQFDIPATACCDGFFVSEGAKLVSTTTSPLLQLTNNSTFNAGPADESGGNFVSATDRSADPASITAAASIALNGPLLFMDSSSLSALFSLLRVVRSTVASTATDGLILAVRSEISLGGFDPIAHLIQRGSVLELRSADASGTPATAATVQITGPLLLALASTISATNAVLNVHNGAQFSSTTPFPLIGLVGTELNLGSESLAGSGRVLNVFGTGGPDGTTPAKVVLNGGLLATSEASAINALEGLVYASDGQIVSSSTDPLVRLIGGIHSLADNVGASMFMLGGIPTAPTADEVVNGVTMTLGTFAPIVTPGSLLRLEDGASVSGQKAFFIDTALFEATAPVFDLARGSNLTVATTAGVDGGLMDLNARAKVVAAGPVVRLDASAITVLNNSAFRVAGGSLLKVTGDFLSLNNNSVLDARNGTILKITGPSAVNIGGAFATFGPVGFSLIKVNNAFCGSFACGTFSGIPIGFTNGASPAQISVTGSAVKGTQSGAIVQSNPSAAAILVDGKAARLTITGQSPKLN